MDFSRKPYFPDHLRAISKKPSGRLLVIWNPRVRFRKQPLIEEVQPTKENKDKSRGGHELATNALDDFREIHVTRQASLAVKQIDAGKLGEVKAAKDGDMRDSVR